MMTYANVLDEVISSLKPENIPVEYIIMAKIVNSSGVEKVLRGQELEKFLNDPNRGQHVLEASVILNVMKIRETIIHILMNFFDELDLATANLPPPSSI